MNARPALDRIAAALEACHLEAILIGNAAAALHGAPVTTLDFDFLFRKTPTNLRKLKALATRLHGTLLRPYYPVSSLYRLMTDDGPLQLDFMSMVHGIRSFESARSRATEVVFGGSRLRVASLADVVRSKRATGRPKDRAVLPILEETLREIEARAEKKPSRRQVLDALRRESERDVLLQIRRLLALPMAERTHFLRVRLPGGGSAL